MGDAAVGEAGPPGFEPHPCRPLRIGTLGAARITPLALLTPARAHPDVEVVAVAARDAAKAERFARKHGIGRVFDDYSALIEAPDVDAIYNPLPNSHHHAWSIQALEAGKHVLCEKPLASNAEEASEMVAVAGRTRRLLMEALHWRHHPLAARMRAIIDSGELGRIHRVEADFCVPNVAFGDIRYRFDLAGGALMDLGVYAVSCVRHLAGREPMVVSAEAREKGRGVDRWARAELDFGDGLTGRVTCSMFSTQLLKSVARVEGEAGSLYVLNPMAPQFYNRMTVRSAAGKRVERWPASSYAAQLDAFVEALRTGASPLTDGPDGVANMRVIDAIYRAAGLPLRGEALA